MVLKQMIIPTYVQSFVFPLLNYGLLSPDQFFHFQDSFEFSSSYAVYLPPLKLAEFAD